MSEIELFDEEDNADLMDIAQLVEENKRLNNIIKEVREATEERCREEFGGIAWYIKNILDKGEKND